MERNNNFEKTSEEIKETELDQITGGLKDINPNELYTNGNAIDLLNTDYLSDKIELSI